ncbi:MAG TPA: helix-hairpin-helix domain-containing protein [Azospirillum sp.]|nr:helix-hairpin-helix domain-containing protein [Azospirillum sp.]
MDIDKKTIAGAAAAVAVGATGAAAAYVALKGRRAPGNGQEMTARPSRPKGRGKRKGPVEAPPEGPININQAAHRDLMSLKHIGKARAKRILAHRPYKSVDDLVSRKLIPQDVLDEVRDRVAI